ncbi:MAG: type 1 pili tip component [Haliea sp.]|uniref:type 1 pili tip component n=1 Tax=Haliea sp. TaxID=1932666 RepID=UPI0032EB1648
MRIEELARNWESEATGEEALFDYRVSLPLEDAAKLEALTELFPRRIREQLIAELLSAAMDDLVSCMPYAQGERVIARDDRGDPIYEDVGLTPEYLRLTQEHRRRLLEQKDEQGPSPEPA